MMTTARDSVSYDMLHHTNLITTKLRVHNSLYIINILFNEYDVDRIYQIVSYRFK